MIRFAIIFVFLFSNAVCRLVDGPSVCKSQEIVKQEGHTQQVKTFCCEGYKEENGGCVYCPECTSLVCPVNYCGDTCIEMCDCPHHAYCDTLYCCICEPGFHGVFCNETCARGFYGPGCKNKCSCHTMEKCDPFTGNCFSYISNNSTILPPGTTCTSNLNNSANSLFHDSESATSENQPQVTVAFTVIVSGVIMGGAMIIIIAFISCAISCIRDRNELYIFGDAQTTQTIGHYVDINPNDELSQDELRRLHEPFRPLPSYANGVNQPLQLVQHNSIINTSHTTNGPKISHTSIYGAGYIHKCLSLPILSSTGKREAQTNTLKKLQSRSCDQLLHASIYISESDYLNPYCSLLQSGLTGSDYLNPYTTLLNATEEGKQIN